MEISLVETKIPAQPANKVYSPPQVFFLQDTSIETAGTSVPEATSGQLELDS